MIDINEEVVDDVASGFHIPARPIILTQLQKLMSLEESCLSDEAKVISKDVALSSAILKTINSPFYGLDRRICNIRQAVNYIGQDAIHDLVTALLFRRSFDRIPCCISLARFWDDAKDVANAMSFIAKNIAVKLPEQCLYSTGLFHDCGIPAFANKFADYKETLIETNKEECSSIALEERKYSTNHAVIGYFIATSWYLPKDVCNIILYHHDINFLAKATGTNEHLGYAALKLAENLVDRNKRFVESPDWKYVGDDVLNVLGIEMNEYIDLDKYYSSLLL